MKENDCISRKQTIERLKLNFPISQGADNSRDRHRYMQAMADIQAIRELPSVTPQEPKTGHWIPTYGNVECSVCGSVKDSRDVGKATHYCDFCGARMVEPQEGEKI